MYMKNENTIDYTKPFDKKLIAWYQERIDADIIWKMGLPYVKTALWLIEAGFCSLKEF